MSPEPLRLPKTPLIFYSRRPSWWQRWGFELAYIAIGTLLMTAVLAAFLWILSLIGWGLIG